MKKLLIVLFFLSFVFLFFSLNVKAAFAITTYHSSIWDNTAGTIPITVSYYIKNADGQTVITRTVSLAAGAWANDQPTESAYNPPYTLTWWTSCTDPQIDPVATSELKDGNWVVAYERQYVQCTTTNGEPAITTASCPAPGTTFSASWGMTGGGPYNVDHYSLFFAQSWDNNVINNSFIGNVPASQTSWSTGGLSPGANYGFRVSAVSPQGNFSSPAYAYQTCQAPLPPAPTGLSTSQVCSGNYKADATLSWTAVSGATGYKVYRWTGSDWSLLATTSSTSYVWSGITSAGETWNVSAYNANGEGPKASAVGLGFTRKTCAPPTASITGPTSLTVGQSGTFSASANQSSDSTLSKGQMHFASTTADLSQAGSWTQIGTDQALSGQTGSFSKSYTWNTAGTYYVTVDIYNATWWKVYRQSHAYWRLGILRNK